MLEPITTPETKYIMTQTDSRVTRAADIATGRTQPDPTGTGWTIVGAKKDLNCKGNGPEWYRLVHRYGSWQYVSEERLPSGNFRAAERRATVSGTVFEGEIVAGHHRGGAVESVRLVCYPDSEGKVLVECVFSIRRDGLLAVTLPDGTVIALENPRKRA
jgi:hypothetical protein